MDEITIGDKLYVSSKRAAQITGYAKDYIGQLCREGRVEARLVGRNWYVLDSALRAHRFGKEEAPEPKNEAPKSPESPISTWKRPEYIPETPVFVPTLAPKPVNPPQDQDLGSPAIADMQTAWREWFQDKKEVVAAPDAAEAEVEAPKREVIDPKDEFEEEISEEKEEEIQINRIEDVAEEPEESVEIHRSYVSHVQPVVISQPPILTRDYAKKADSTEVKLAATGSTTLLKVLLVGFALTSIVIAILGTGQAERLLGGTSLNYGFQKSVTDFLGGKSEYKSSL